VIQDSNLPAVAGLWPLAGNYDISIEEYLIGLGDTGLKSRSTAGRTYKPFG